MQLVKGDATDLFVISVLLLIGISGLVLFSFYSECQNIFESCMFRDFE